jgi:phosphoribosylglycinamide formyltransferase 1
MIKIAVFVSGGGSNLQAIIDAIKSGFINEGYIEIVFSNKKEAFGLERAIKQGIKTLSMDPAQYASREEFDEYLAGKMNSFDIDLICLAGYMRILTKTFLDKFKGKVMNIHPALLPSFGGEGMYGHHVHEAVLNHGCKVSGCTVHFVDSGTDTGPIIVQKTVAVEEGDTPETLQKRVLEFEHKAYPEAVKFFTEGKLKIDGRKVIIKK